jgi:tRNA A-37 threonylcarbamoyl transferase component Bud32
VDKQYEQYCLADPIFYDSPQQRDAQAVFPVALRPLPGGWRRACQGDWLVNVPPGPPPPAQGWKIHVSTCLDNSDEVIAKVWDYCVPRRVSFKFVGSRMAVLMRNAKYASRSASGKAVTIYPVDEAACERILRDLDSELSGSQGPYILSDLRYGAGPLYVRYGGFMARFCLDSGGEMVSAIENPAGDLVPDPRSQVFKMPEWVKLPEFLAPHLATRNSVTMTGLEYELTGALHFSNGGGVYTANHKPTGEQVILKEARPYAGLAADGSDAVTRLRRERDTLLRLSGLGIAPEVRGTFQVGEHQFLAEEFIPGKTLYSRLVERHPLGRPAPDPVAAEEYTAWALQICSEVERAAATMHERGIVFNDLHMFNVMVRPGETVALIDFEAASDIGAGRTRTVGNPGFAAPRDRTGTDVDAYSLACLRLAMFLPLTTLFPLDKDKPAQLAAEIARLFPVPEAFLDEALREITRDPARPSGSAGPARPDPDSTRLAVTARAVADADSGDARGRVRWDELAADLVRAIRASATPDRTDRLFPGDIDQFRVSGGGLGLAHGAAGVLFALSEAAGVRVPEYEEWLATRAAQPPQDARLGLYSGLAGVAYTLARLGRLDAAVATARLCLGKRWHRLGHDLHDGLSGFALAMMSVGDKAGEPELSAAGQRAARTVVAPYLTARPGSASQRAAGGPVGLLRGASGKALLFIRLYERTGNPDYLDAAEGAIAADLAQSVTGRHGALQVNDKGRRSLPYLGGGSGGIGLVIDQFTAHRGNEEFANAARGIRLAASSGLYVQAGLFDGRAGMIACLASARDAGQAGDDSGTETAARVIGTQVDRLAWHAVRYGDGVAFPGDMLLRLSMDLGTGTAGVLLGTAAALAPHGAVLPFFARPARLPARATGDSRRPLREPVATSAEKEVKVIHGSPRYSGDGARA